MQGHNKTALLFRKEAGTEYRTLNKTDLDHIFTESVA